MTIDAKNEQIVNLLAEGYSVKQIAPQVCLAFDTVKLRIQKMKEATGVKNTTSLIAYCYERGLIKPKAA